MLALAVVAGGCSYAWDALRPLPDAGVVAPVDVVPIVDVGAPQDDAGPPTMDAGTPDAGSVVDVPRDVASDRVEAAVLDGATVDAVVDVPRTLGPDATSADAGAVDAGPCVGASCPCAPSTPAGWCAVGRACVGGACTTVPLAGALVITEIQNNPDTARDNDGEWFEVYNPAASAVDLRDLHVHGSATERFTIGSTQPVLVPARGYAVLAYSQDTMVNGGVTAVYAYGSAMTLGNTGTDTIELRGADDATVIHTVTYDTTAASGWPNVAGRSKALRPSSVDPAVTAMPASWCVGDPMYGAGGYGTPGAVNVCM